MEQIWQNSLLCFWKNDRWYSADPKLATSRNGCFALICFMYRASTPGASCSARWLSSGMAKGRGGRGWARRSRKRCSLARSVRQVDLSQRLVSRLANLMAPMDSSKSSSSVSASSSAALANWRLLSVLKSSKNSSSRNHQ